MEAKADTFALLGSNDPSPVVVLNAGNKSPILLLCEHAGQAIPEKLNNLGLPENIIDTHIGWDIGAERLATKIAENLSAPLILQRYSRLVVDCNRPPANSGSIPVISDGIEISANRECSNIDAQVRIDEIFKPLNEEICAQLDQYPRTLLISIHSFTPKMNGETRLWNAGFLSRTDMKTANQLKRSISDRDSKLFLALNEPYQIDDETDWFIPQYAEKRNLAHTLIEVRNDQLQTESGIEEWAGLISEAIRDVLEGLK